MLRWFHRWCGCGMYWIGRGKTLDKCGVHHRSDGPCYFNVGGEE